MADIFTWERAMADISRAVLTAQVMLQNLNGAANARGGAAHGIALPQRGIDASQSGWKIRIVRGCAAQIFASW